MNPPLVKPSNTAASGSNHSHSGTQNLAATSSVASIVDAIKSRDEAGLGAIYDRVAQDVYAYAFSVKGNKDSAEDVVEESFWLAWEWIDSYSPASMPVERWLLAVAGKVMGVEDKDVPANVNGLGGSVPFNKGRSAGIRSRLFARAHSHRDGKMAVVRRSVDAPPPRIQKRQRWVDTVGQAAALTQGVSADRDSSVDHPVDLVEDSSKSAAISDPTLFEAISDSKLLETVSTPFEAVSTLTPPDVVPAPTLPASVPAATYELTSSEPSKESSKSTQHSLAPAETSTDLEIFNFRRNDTQQFAAAVKKEDSKPAPRKSTESRKSSSPVKTISWLIFSAVVGCVVYFAQEYRFNQPGVAGEIPAASNDSSAALLTRISQMESELAKARATQGVALSPQARVIDLMNYSSRDPQGKVLWNQELGEWRVRLYNFRLPKEGSEFVLWGVANGLAAPVNLAKIEQLPDGSFEAVGHGAIQAAQFVRVMVTEEPIGSTAQSPTSAVVLAGR